MANHPHNSKRPPKQSVLRALTAGNISAVERYLTPRQRAFCREYIVDFNGTQAAIRAGYKKEYADRAAYLCMMNDGVRALIDHYNESKASKLMTVDPNYVLARITEIVNKEGAKDGDKLRGLELLARHLGMLTDRTEITGKDGGPLQHEEVQREVEDFTNRLTLIATRKDPRDG